jgi:hypothetical protein
MQPCCAAFCKQLGGNRLRVDCTALLDRGDALRVIGDARFELLHAVVVRPTRDQHE